MHEYTLPTLDVVRGSIRPITNANYFEIKLTIIQMIHNILQFKGNMTEDLNQHLKWFLLLYDTFKFNGIIDDTIRHRFFLFSLCDNAYAWLELQVLGLTTTWNELAGSFLHKIFPISKTILLRVITPTLSKSREKIYMRRGNILKSF